MFCKKVVLRNFAKSTGKHLCQSLFFNKVAGHRPATLLKKRLWHRSFPVNFVRFLRTHFLQNTSGRPLLQCQVSKTDKNFKRNCSDNLFLYLKLLAVNALFQKSVTWSKTFFSSLILLSPDWKTYGLFKHLELQNKFSYLILPWPIMPDLIFYKHGAAKEGCIWLEIHF